MDLVEVCAEAFRLDDPFARCVVLLRRANSEWTIADHAIGSSDFRRRRALVLEQLSDNTAPADVQTRAVIISGAVVKVRCIRICAASKRCSFGSGDGFEQQTVYSNATCAALRVDKDGRGYFAV